MVTTKHSAGTIKTVDSQKCSRMLCTDLPKSTLVFASYVKLLAFRWIIECPSKPLFPLRRRALIYNLHRARRESSMGKNKTSRIHSFGSSAITCTLHIRKNMDRTYFELPIHKNEWNHTPSSDVEDHSQGSTCRRHSCSPRIA